MQRDEETKRARDEVTDAPPSSTSSFRLSVASSLALLCCAALLTAFALTSWLAWRHKCATYDEPMHLVAAWIQIHDADFRCNPEDPPLWKYYAIAGLSRDRLKIDHSSPGWSAMLQNVARHDPFARYTLYQTPGTDADAVLNAARAHMVLLGALFAAVIAWWAWRLAGPLAAVVATAAFCLDPNFLANAPLVKNDVPIALALLGLTAALWLVGRRATLFRCAAVGLLLGAGLTTKFSGLLGIPILALLLLGRVVLPDPWSVLAWTARTRLHRLLAACAIALAALALSYALIWACYDFRFRMGNAPNTVSDFHDVLQITARYQAIRDHQPSWDLTVYQLEQWAAQWRPDRFVRSVLWINQHHLLPNAWLVGLLYTYGSTMYRGTFLCGQLSLSGWWYYFPLAMAFKTPLATLIGLALALCVWLAKLRGRFAALWHRPWTVIAAGVPPALYLFMALRSNVNLGLRHILPVYPFLFIWMGVVAAAAAARWPKSTAAVIAAFLLGLAVETYCAYPDFLPFFNVAAGGARGGLGLLSDSNLDWGQDLPSLRDWQKLHPDRQLALCYFGSVDPRYYGIRYQNLPFSQAPNDLPVFIHPPAVLAISATFLQGLHMNSAMHRRYQLLLHGQQLIAVLGGSIYLYEVR